MMHDMETAIRCRDLKKTYDGKVEAVRGLDLAIEAGECFGLLGPNGAGKTTTIEILEGLLEPTSGEVEILGMTWAGARTRTARVAGDLPAGDAAGREVDRPGNAGAVRQLLSSAAPRCRAYWKRCLSTEKADAMVGKLSGGQKQRLAVATALVGNPQGSLSG